MTGPDIQMDLTDIRMNPDKYEQSPVQVLETVNGYPFLFYARWDFWDFSIPLAPNIDLYSVTSAEGGFYREGDNGPMGGNAVEDMPDEHIVEIIRQCAGEFAREHPAKNIKPNRENTMTTAKKSFYALEIFVQPGGARKAEVHVHSNLDAIKAAMDEDLSFSIDLLAWYGEDIALLTYQQGEEVQKVNLLPHIRVRVEGYPEIWFDENSVRHGVKFDNQAYAAGYAANPDPAVNYKDFMEVVDAGKFTAVMDWDAVPVLPLEGEPAQRGDRLRIHSNYKHDKELIGYGLNEIEEGIYEDESIGLDDEEDEE